MSTPTPQRITASDQPVFPCWLYVPPAPQLGEFEAAWVHHVTPVNICVSTHWLPDQPTAPTVVPDNSQDLARAHPTTPAAPSVLVAEDEGAALLSPASRAVPDWATSLTENVHKLIWSLGHRGDEYLGAVKAVRELVLASVEHAPAVPAVEGVREAIRDAVDKTNNPPYFDKLPKWAEARHELLHRLYAAVKPFLSAPTSKPEEVRDGELAEQMAKHSNVYISPHVTWPPESEHKQRVEWFLGLLRQARAALRADKGGEG